MCQKAAVSLAVICSATCSDWYQHTCCCLLLLTSTLTDLCVCRSVCIPAQRRHHFVFTRQRGVVDSTLDGQPCTDFGTASKRSKALTLFHQSQLSAVVAQTCQMLPDQRLTGHWVHSLLLLTVRCCSVAQACLWWARSLETWKALVGMDQTGACSEALPTCLG